jgi:hypothetical protein
MNTVDGNNKRYTVNVICLTIKEGSERERRPPRRQKHKRQEAWDGVGEKEKEREEPGGHECKYLL